MRTRSMMVAVAAAGLLVTGAVAQHEEHHKDQAPPPATSAETAKMGGMMSEMPKMMMGQAETSKALDELMKSFAAIESEKDPAILKTKLSEHGALLRELQSKIQAHSHMMEMMQHRMGGTGMTGKMMGGEAKK